MKTIIDLTAKDFSSIFLGTGKRGLEVELSPDDLKNLTNAKLENIQL